MNRLIDEKEFINSRPENLNPNMSDEIESAYNKGWNDCNSEWISLIEKQPIAYDINKVIEQLKEVSIDYCREYGYAEDENILYLPDVIEIIKRGGIE